MKKKAFAFLVLINPVFAQTKNNDIEHPQIFEQNKEKANAPFVFFDKKEDVIRDDYSRSAFYQSLNGIGKCNQDDYKLLWADEFDKDGRPDSASWTYERGFVRNEEIQWYQADNASCKNGWLIIEARKEVKPNPDYVSGSTDWRKNRAQVNYTSACLITRGLRSWQYGRFEMKARIDVGKGMWPAWWTLGVNGRWPANGEIDIMEYYRGKLLANIACLGAGQKPEWHSIVKPVDSLGGKEWSSKFHTWRMDWTEDYIELYVDDQLLNKLALDSLTNKDGSGFNPFKQPHYILLNLALGGTSGGDPDDTGFPKKFEIDYIRVYQKTK